VLYGVVTIKNENYLIQHLIKLEIGEAGV